MIKLSSVVKVEIKGPGWVQVLVARVLTAQSGARQQVLAQPVQAEPAVWAMVLGARQHLNPTAKIEVQVHCARQPIH